MTDKKPTRLGQAAAYFNVGKEKIVDCLKAKGVAIDEKNLNAKIDEQMFNILAKEFNSDMFLKEEADQILLGAARKEPEGSADDKKSKEEEVVLVKTAAPVEVITPAEEEKPKTKKQAETPETPVVEAVETKVEKIKGIKVVGKMDLNPPKVEEKSKKKAAPQEEEKQAEEEVIIVPEAESDANTVVPAEEEKAEHIETKYQQLEGVKIKGKIEIKEVDKNAAANALDKKKRKRIQPSKAGADANTRIKLDNKPKDKLRKDTPFRKPDGKSPAKPEQRVITEKEIEEQIKRTKAALNSQGNKSSRQKIRREKRAEMAEKAEANREVVNDKLLKVTEFISVSELANLMKVSAIEVIKACMSIGVIVSINQRLDAEVIELVASEFGFEVEFISVEDSTSFEEEIDDPAKMQTRAPIVTIMGHVDHGKTSLLDYIRSANVVKKEAGGITQHIGAYDVLVPKHNRKITFLDTPGHEAFTAMRARGAKLTDVAVIVIAADDKVMPQTKEAISHAQSANVPMIFALNKIDKPGANPEGVRTQLSEMNILVESWGGKFQEQEISAKKGTGVAELLEKILLESDLLDLKANPDKLSVGVVIEASLDKGRGYVATVLVEGGTLNVGDFIVAGSYYGKIKAMYDHNGEKKTKVFPGEPVQILGLNGAPSAGEKFKEFDNEQEAKQLAQKRSQIEREQGMRTRKHITLDEIGRRLALGTFKELNVIIKGDVDGSVEALTDSLQKLSTAEIQVNVLHRAVGAITESDVLLASASDAIIIGFQVRPNAQAKILAEKESIDIRLYSVIYQVIDEIKAAMEGLLEPTIEEKITGNIEIKEVFKITKVGNIAGCFVLDGKVTNKSKIRIIRDGIVTHSGALESLKRYKDDVKEVVKGMECGLSIKNYNDIQVGDIIEAYEEIEIKRKL
jgi:translation initiation factor IF-2